MSGRKKQLFLLVVFILAIVLVRSSPFGSIITFENLKQNREALVAFVGAHYFTSAASFIAVYVIATALSVPGAVVLSLAGGFLFGTAAGVVYINIGATAGAACAFLSARYLLGNRLQQKYEGQLSKFNNEMDRSGTSYLLTLRLIPIFPF